MLNIETTWIISLDSKLGKAQTSVLSKKGREENYSGLASGCPRGLWCSGKLEVSGQELHFQYYRKSEGVFSWNIVTQIYL